jgi:hypothetical protein
MEPSAGPGPKPALGERHYTVVLAGAGHRTLEVTRAGPDLRAGPLIVSYLCGPDKASDYRAFAHITAAGDGRLWPGRTPVEKYGHSFRTVRRQLRDCRAVPAPAEKPRAMAVEVGLGVGGAIIAALLALLAVGGLLMVAFRRPAAPRPAPEHRSGPGFPPEMLVLHANAPTAMETA